MIPAGTSFGQYRVLRRLGGGGAGDVYLCEASAQGGPKRVALKALDGTPNDIALLQLIRQVETAANLRNPYIIPFHGFARERSHMAVVLAYAPGGSLGDALRLGDRVSLPLPNGVVARIVVQVARALDAAHAAGLVHGDLKPNNVFVRTSPRGTPIAAVSDFGQDVLTQAAATLAMRGEVTAQQAEWVADQLRFAAPEQLGGPAVPASDQYALAAIAYALLTGQPPFAGGVQQLLSAIPHQAVTPPSQLNPAIPREAERALLRALAKQPDARFPSVKHFAELFADTVVTPGATSAAGGVTEHLSALAATRDDIAAATRQGPSLIGSAGAALREAPSALRHGAPADALDDLPADASPRTNRMLAAGVAVALLALLLTCVITTSLLWTGPDPAGLRGDLTRYLGPDRTPSATQVPTQTVESPDAQAAESRWAGVAATQPVFSETFASNAAHWATSATVAVHDSHLYVSNATGTAPAFAAAPGLASLASVGAQVDITLTQGAAADSAGLCFFVSKAPGGKQSFYCYLASSDGRYAVWYFDSQQWRYITGGYASALKLGMNTTNTLEMLASGRDGSMTLLANGRFVANLTLPLPSQASGGVGLLTLNIGAQAAFTNLAIYSVQ
jgi:hypothetical protein